MKTIIFSILTASVITLAGTMQVNAQRHDDDKYWEHRKESAKKRDEYYRERDKKRAEYAREASKKEREFYKEDRKRRKEYVKDVRKHGLPSWARAHHYDASRHVYFRDYATYYDPYRAGYVYMNSGRWQFSASIPAFLLNVDLGRARINVVSDIPLDRHPEDFYDEDDWDD